MRRFGITKAGNGLERRTLIEGAWTYRHLPHTGRAKLVLHERVSPAVRGIAEGADAPVRPLQDTVG